MRALDTHSLPSYLNIQRGKATPSSVLVSGPPPTSKYHKYYVQLSITYWIAEVAVLSFLTVACS